jgi:hypothetical protein
MTLGYAKCARYGLNIKTQNTIYYFCLPTLVRIKTSSLQDAAMACERLYSSLIKPVKLPT